jgi:hypothetical protein
MCRYGAPGDGHLVTFGARVRCALSKHRSADTGACCESVITVVRPERRVLRGVGGYNGGVVCGLVG